MEAKLAIIGTEISPEIVKAFHLMWDIFPAPTTLLKKDRTVVACNPAATAKGFQLGAKCFQFSGGTSVHKHCRANEALREGVPQRAIVHNPVSKLVTDSYWLPLAGEKELFVHTVINITEYAKPELFQE